MANKQAAKKALRSSTKKNEINSARRSRIRTFIRKVEDQIKAGDATKAREAFKNLEPELMRGVTKGVFKLNTAARKLTRLAASINKIGTSEAKKPETKKKKTASKK